MSNSKLIPYLNFPGNCEEVLNAYKKVLGGAFEIVTRYDNPAMKVPDDYKNKVLHARFTFDDNIIMASDAFPGQSSSGKGSGDVSLSLSFSDVEKAKQVFNGLAEGGSVRIPFEKQFWGDWHGNFTDKYGIHWMVNVELPK
jgi:PhnB protein